MGYSQKNAQYKQPKYRNQQNQNPPKKQTSREISPPDGGDLHMVAKFLRECGDVRDFAWGISTPPRMEKPHAGRRDTHQLVAERALSQRMVVMRLRNVTANRYDANDKVPPHKQN